MQSIAEQKTKLFDEIKKLEEIERMEAFKNQVEFKILNDILQGWQLKLEKLEHPEVENNYCLSISSWKFAKSSRFEIIRQLSFCKKGGLWDFEFYSKFDETSKKLVFYASSMEDLFPPGGKSDLLIISKFGIRWTVENCDLEIIYHLRMASEIIESYEQNLKKTKVIYADYKLEACCISPELVMDESKFDYERSIAFLNRTPDRNAIENKRLEQLVAQICDKNLE